jgi:hypothetical protein
MNEKIISETGRWRVYEVNILWGVAVTQEIGVSGVSKSEPIFSPIGSIRGSE